MNSSAPDIGTLNITILGIPRSVVLFNDESHSMDEVQNQIIKAVHCTPEQACAFMLDAHTTGRTIVFTGSLERCEHVEYILAEEDAKTLAHLQAIDTDFGRV